MGTKIHNSCLSEQKDLYEYKRSLCLMKTGVMKMFGIGFFYLFSKLFFETLWEKFSLFSMFFVCHSDFLKTSINGNSYHFSVCLHNPLISFYLTPLSTAFKTVCGDIIGPIFFFFIFTKTTFSNLSFRVQSIERIIRRSST